MTSILSFTGFSKPARRLRSIVGVLVTLFLSSLTATAQQPGTSPVKIFVLVGQSNMVGHGNMSPVGTQGTLEYIVENDPGGDYQFLSDGAGGWETLNDVWIHYERNGDILTGDLTAGYGGSATGVGPELGFGHVASGQYENQVLIIKTAWGGKSLGNDFLPPSAATYPTPQAPGDPGFYYAEILRLVNDAIDNLDTYFPDYDPAGGYEIAGFGWHQGWNDRVSDPFSAAYETNMAHFIRDIRTDLEVPGLPFVIATSAMDGNGPGVYTQVELAQRAMLDPYLTNATPPDLYTDFVGNVAVVDCRTTYDGMDFWQPVEFSPANQGYHWNRNAKTYVNIGLAMGDAMSTLSPGRCPSRLRATGAPGGIQLSWQNGLDTPTSVQILRNGVEIAPAASVDPPTFLDTAALPGVHDYQFIFTMPGDPCDPLTVTFDGSIANLEAYRDPAGIGLTWENLMTYTGIELRRDGVLIEPSLPGGTTSYIDTSPPASGLVTYTAVPTTGTAAQTQTQINLDGPPTGNALIYEPFDYIIGGLNLKSSDSEVGLEGAWNANSLTLVTAGTLTWGELPVGGAKLSEFRSGQNRFGGARSIRATALADNGLLTDDSTLWFSMLTGVEEGANRTNSRIAVALAAGSFGTGNGDFFINGGTGVGLYLGAGVPKAASFPADTGGATLASNSNPQYEVGDWGLTVGKITWGATPGDLDTIELFQPDTDLVLPASPISTLTVTVDQTAYDTLTFRRGDRVLLDEIRFGASYSDVVARDFVDDPDNVKPSPDPMTFAAVPTAVTDTSITMTAERAFDVSGVEYYFTCTSANAPDSSWQSSRTYTPTGLSPLTLYSYTVKARDMSPVNNETAASGAEDVTTFAVDITAPTPNPMTFAVVPAAVTNTSITMTANPATDNIYGVQYLFSNTTNSTDSGWLASETWTDIGLTPNTLYTYTVTARDTGPFLNAGTASDPESTSTLPTDDTAPTPNPATWATVPTAVSDTEVTMTADAATDDQYDVEYYFANPSVVNGSHDSGWQDSATYNDTGLTAFTSYTYQVTVRDKSYANNEGAPSDPLPAVTNTDPAITTPSLVEGQFYFVGSDNNGGANYNLSVFPGSARYSGTTTPVGPVYAHFGDGTALDYRFFREAPANDNTIASYADGAEGLISDLTTADTDISNESYAKVWTTVDPGNDFTANSADFTSNTLVSNLSPTATGTIDVSGMTEGIIYFIYGAYRSTPVFELVMSGAGQTDVTLNSVGNNDGANNNENYVVAVNFLNAEDYDTISYSFNCSNGRFMGVVLEGESTGGGNDFANWIGNYTLTDTSFGGDDDGDNLGNGIEAFFGTDPSVSNAGLTQVSNSGEVTTFTHPYAEPQLSDVTGSYEWSLDLVTWYPDTTTTVGDTTVTIAASAPASGTVTVTADTAGSAVTPVKFFVRAVATK
jgi:hypothetical protein